MNVFFFILMMASPRPSGSPDEIIVLAPLTSLGSTEESVIAIQQVLEGELRGLLGDALRLTATLEEDPALRDALGKCGGAPSCLVEIIGGLGWEGVIVGNVAGLGDERVINLRLLDARSGDEKKRLAVVASGDERELILQMRRAAVQLVAPDQYLGAIRIVADQPGVQILVDGELLGTTPLENTSFPLSVGRHAIEASGDGLVPFSDMVELEYGETRDISISLPPSTLFVGGDTPYRQRWWTWTLAGAGITGLGLGGYFNYLHAQSVDDIESQSDNGGLTSQDASLFEDRSDRRDRALIFYGVGGALTLAAATLLSLDLL